MPPSTKQKTFNTTPQFYYILSSENVSQKDIDSKKSYIVPINYGGGGVFVKESLAAFNDKDTVENANVFEAKVIIASNNPALNLPQLSDADLQTWCDNPTDEIMVDENLSVKFEDGWDDIANIYFE